MPVRPLVVCRFCARNSSTARLCARACFADFGTTGPDADYKWGAPVERYQEVKPGDVVQFRDVTLLIRSPSGAKAVRRYPHHTAVVARNRGGGRFDLYEQNVLSAGADAERRGKLRKRDFDLRAMIGGRVWFYRPEAK